MAYTKQIWENLPSTNTPLTAERLNHMEDGIYEASEELTVHDSYSNSTTEPYSANYVNDVLAETQSYSTNEQNTNKIWIDDKPIYRKVIDTTIDDVETELNNLNCDTLISIEGEYQTSYNFNWRINCYPGSGNENYSLRIYRTRSTGAFNVRYGSFVPSTNSITMIVEYTKTTD